MPLHFKNDSKLNIFFAIDARRGTDGAYPEDAAPIGLNNPLLIFRGRSEVDGVYESGTRKAFFRSHENKCIGKMLGTIPNLTRGTESRRNKIYSLTIKCNNWKGILFCLIYFALVKIQMLRGCRKNVYLKRIEVCEEIKYGLKWSEE